jgi:hypothetical protein
VELKVSKPVQIVGAVAILAGVAFFLMMGRMGGGAQAAPVSHLNPHPFAKKGHAAPKKKSSLGTLGHTLQRSGKTAKHAAPLAAPALKKKPAKQPARTKRPIPVVASDGLPVAISRALAMHPVVVAVLYDPQSRVDSTSTGEAKAGAAIANAGYVPVNVLRRSEVQAIAERYGVIHAPTVLVFRRPAELYVQLTGFADKETVAQAVMNAYPVVG